MARGYTQISGFKNQATFEFTSEDKNVLGRGGFGVVYRGRDANNHNRTVAIKQQVMPKNREEMEQLKIELGVIVDLMVTGCEHLVMTHDFSFSKERMFLVMEYCEGGDVLNYLKRNIKMDKPTLQRMAFHVALALYELSARNIIHRDLKPANIMIAVDKNKPHPLNMTFKLGDFGISRHLDVKEMAMTLAGTPVYLAPEVLMQQPYGSEVDTWSLGVIFYECFTGNHPFNWSHVIAYAMQTKKPALWQGVDVSDCPMLFDLINNMIKVDPKERYKPADFFKHPYITTDEFKMKLEARSTRHRNVQQELRRRYTK